MYVCVCGILIILLCCLESRLTFKTLSIQPVVVVIVVGIGDLIRTV